MATHESRPVVAAVDGGSGGEAALRYAVDEAVRRGEGLHVVHVWPGGQPRPFPADLAGSEAAGRVILDHATEVAWRLAPGLQISTQLLVGPRSMGILAAARGGRLLVVGRPPRHHHVPLGATPAGVTARAECPTVVVPPHWTAEHSRGVIVVGMRSRIHARELLSHAFETAHLRGSRIEVVTAWGLYDPAMDRDATRTQPAHWQSEGARVLEELLVEWGERYPAVLVEVRVIHGKPATVLVEASADADVLVIARRRNSVPPYGRLGGTSQAVLRSSRTPVEVVPAGAVADTQEPGRTLRPV